MPTCEADSWVESRPRAARTPAEPVSPASTERSTADRSSATNENSAATNTAVPRVSRTPTRTSSHSVSTGCSDDGAVRQGQRPARCSSLTSVLAAAPAAPPVRTPQPAPQVSLATGCHQGPANSPTATRSGPAAAGPARAHHPRGRRRRRRSRRRCARRWPETRPVSAGRSPAAVVPRRPEP